MPARPNRRYDKPYYEIARVNAAASERDVVITARAGLDAARVLPNDLIDIAGEIRNIVASLTADEYQFTDRRTRKVNDKSITSIVDVYRIDFEGSDIWLKIKIEAYAADDYVVVISFHEWDDSRAI